MQKKLYYNRIICLRVITKVNLKNADLRKTCLKTQYTD